MPLWLYAKAILALVWKIKCDGDHSACPVWVAVPKVKYDLLGNVLLYSCLCYTCQRPRIVCVWVSPSVCVLYVRPAAVCLLFPMSTRKSESTHHISLVIIWGLCSLRIMVPCGLSSPGSTSPTLSKCLSFGAFDTHQARYCHAQYCYDFLNSIF